VLLARQNMSLKTQITELSRQLAEADGARVDRLRDGESLGTLSVTPEGGETGPLVFGAGETRTLLLIFSVHCPACNQTMPLWEDLVADVADTEGLRIIGVQTDQFGEGEAGELVTAALPFEVYGLDHDASPGMARIPFIPATLVVGPDGVAERVWFGLPGDEDLDELRDLLAG